jgi:5-methylcytosine-specific restriction enzyme B
LIEDDKRLGESNEIRVTLPYSGSFFAVPPNLVLLGTMNTADRSIALLDIALRRRFTFIEQMPDPNQLGIVDGLSLSRVLELLNQQLCRLIDRDHQIGRSYLMDINSLAELEFVWYQRIIPLLQEYFYNDTSRLRDVLTNAFVRSQESSAGSKLDWSTETMEREYMPIQRLTGDQFRQALLHFLNAQPYL